MSVRRVKQLLRGFAKSGYVDVLKDTPLEQHGMDHDFGLYVVRGVLERDVQESWAEDCQRMFAQKSCDPGGTKLGKNYSTLQAVLNECTCKYNYAGTAKHVATQLYEGGDNGVCEVLLKSVEWANGKSRCTSEEGEEGQWG